MSDLLPPLVLMMMSKFDDVYTGIGKVNKEVAGMEAAAGGSMSNMEKGFNSMAGVGKVALLGVGAAAVAVGAVSVKMASDFQSQMTLLVTAAGESQSNMSTVSNGILDMAGATGTSIDQLSEGMYTIEKAGIRGADGLTVLKAAAEGAKAENVDLSTATNALTSVMMSYHLKASDAVSVQNELIAGSGMAKTTMENYAGSLSTVIPVASAAGVGFDQVAGAIATLTQHGTSADEATQELSNTIRGLQAPNQVAQKAMQQLGLSVNDVSQGLADPNVGLTGTIAKITDAIGNSLGPAGLSVVDTFKKSQSASADLQTMLGTMPHALQTASQAYLDGTMTATAYNKVIHAMDGASSTQGQQFLRLAKTTQGFNDLLKSGQPEAQTFAAQLKAVMGGATGMNTALMLGGENMAYFKTATEEVAKAGGQAGSDISTWAQTQQNLSVQVDKAKESLAAMGVRIGTALIPIVSQALAGMTQWVGWLGNHQGVLIAFASVVGVVLGSAILAYIAHLVVAGVQSVVQFAKMIAAGAVWAAQTTATFAQAVAGGAVWVAQSLIQFGEWLAAQASAIADSVPVWAAYYGPQMLSWVAKQASAFASMMASAAVWLASHVATFATATATLVANGAAWVANAAVVTGQAIVGFLRAAPALAAATAGVIANTAATVASETVMIAGAVATGVMTAAQWALNAALAIDPFVLIIAGIVLLVGAIIWVATQTTFFQDLWTGAMQVIGDIFNWLWTSVIQPVVNFIVAYFTVLGIAASLLYSNYIQPAFQAAGDILNWWWGSVVQPVFNWVGQAVQNVGTGFSIVFGAIGNVISGAFNGAVSIARSAMNTIIGLVNGIIGGINTVGSAVSTLTGGAVNIHVGTLPSLDVGGTIPGPKGAPVLMIGHGGEDVLNDDMLSGRKPLPAKTAAAFANSQVAGGGGGTINNINVSMQSNASPVHVASTIGWQLRNMA